MKIADSHIHCRFSRYDEICNMLDSISEVGVTDACLLTLPYRGVIENLSALYVKQKYRKLGIRVFGGLHVTDRYAAIPAEIQAETLLDMGCDGFKLMFSPDLTKYYGRSINDPYYDKMFTLFEERGTPINIHLADPEDFWGEGKTYDSSFPTYEQLFADTFDMLDRHPRLRVTFAHFMFLSNQPKEAERVMEKYPNVNFDITPGVEMYYNFDKNLDFWIDFFKRYSHRILFGTDCNTVKKSTNQNLEMLVYRKLTEKKAPFTQICYKRDFTVYGFDLDSKTVEDICYNNFFRFIGNEPVPVNRALFMSACKRVLDDLNDNSLDEYYIRGGELIPDLKKDPEQTIARDFLSTVFADAEFRYYFL